VIRDRACPDRSWSDPILAGAIFYLRRPVEFRGVEISVDIDSKQSIGDIDWHHEVSPIIADYLFIARRRRSRTDDEITPERRILRFVEQRAASADFRVNATT
jgi:hypothetical protein